MSLRKKRKRERKKGKKKRKKGKKKREKEKKEEKTDFGSQKTKISLKTVTEILKKTFRIFLNLRGTPPTPPPPPLQICFPNFGMCNAPLGKKNDWKKGGGGKNMVLRTNIHPCHCFVDKP